MKTSSILVTHPWMGRGGSEATAMWTLQALQDDYQVTFTTASPIDWEELNAAYGTSVDPGKIELLSAPHLPTVDGPAKLVRLQLRYFERFCIKVASNYDCCLSSYNPVDFKKPGIQLLGDFSFSEEMRKRLYIYGEEQFQHRDSLLRRLYLMLADWVGVKQRPLRGRGDLLLANSDWCAEQLNQYFGVSKAPVIYPPVTLPSCLEPVDRDPLGFVCLGRVVPEKEIERIIAILKEVRTRGYAANLTLIGALDDSDYSKRIAELISEESWIRPEGFLMLEEKQVILASNAFALHACRIEAFGIAVAEMASMGCIPFVPSTGGACEIVDHEELQYATNEEAVDKIVALLENEERAEAIRADFPGVMKKFGPDIFMKELREHVLEFSGQDPIAIDASAKEDIASMA